MSSPVVCLLKGPSVREESDWLSTIDMRIDIPYQMLFLLAILRILSRGFAIVTVCPYAMQLPVIGRLRFRKKIVGFICDDQLYEWTRTPFGLKSSSQIFCRAVQQILHPIMNIAAAFVDDMVVY